MTLLHWNETYSVGLEAVDYEHQELIGLINRIHDQLRAGAGSITKFLGDLHRGISAHFALEEKLMQDSRYDRLAPHKADHERLLDEIRDIMDACEQTEAIDEAELSRRLEAWFSGHFATHDARLHRAFGAHSD